MTYSIVIFCLFVSFGAAQTLEQPRRAVVDPGVVTTRQAITPAGVPSVFQGRVYGVSWVPGSDALWVLHSSEVYKLDWVRNGVLARISHGGTPGNAGIQTNPATGDAIVSQAVKGKARLVSIEGNAVRPIVEGLGSFQPGALAVARDKNREGKQLAVVPLVWENRLAVIDLTNREVMHQAPTGIAPFAAVIDAQGTVAYVSNLGGRPPKTGEAFAAPAQKSTERIVVDSRGVASTGTVTRVDLRTGEATATIPVGLHPTGMKWDEARHLLYVVNGNSDTISVIDTAKNTVARTMEVQPFSQKVRGIAPTAIDISLDGKTLYVACGGINAIAVMDASQGKIRGLIPTAWYPNSLALDATGKRLAVSALLGAGSGWRESPGKRFVHANRGSVAVIALPDEAQLASYTTAVAENNRLRLAQAEPEPVRAAAAAKAAPVAIPVRSGEPSKIEHVVFIIKENRTYDQVLGDLPKGNGDPSLVMFGEEVTPNQHRLADQFVVLDNFYATGGNSGDGHQWLTQANETEYCLWPGYQGRSYPFDGGDPMAYASGGFLWDYALARGRTVRVYGEYAARMREPGGKARMDLLNRWKNGGDFRREWTAHSDIQPLSKILAANYPGYSTVIPDVTRAQIFLSDLKQYESGSNLPNLMLIQLPSNHTAGTTPGFSSAKAMVADNDLAVGQIVEALTHSKFWPKMAIFIVEDDAQNGVDHVDGHRTTAFLASPYARRGHIDSTFYSHQSILKTIELILGLPTMSLFDLIANDMRQSFTEEANFSPYDAVLPKQDLLEMNPPLQALTGRAREAARQSSRMNWSAPDAAPTEKLNRILWGSVRGWNTPYPAIQHSVFAPLSVDTEDDDRR
ncbi:MAG TPA: bifunctional YncE family protein/alkaline phosphatase family protein [Bryobacteraceae bacterium]|nr:bifunctional YncE family protein/alkaline phosphatase family protein [Bryobacteraceae bacterium]